MSRIKKCGMVTSRLAISGILLLLITVSSASANTWSKLVDYGYEGYSETSNNWKTYKSPESVNGSYRYLSREVGDGSRKGTATWKTEVPYCGTYRVSVSVRKTENRTPDADYFVTNSKGELDHFVINQIDHRNILDWDVLGVYLYEQGQEVKVLLDGTDDGWSDGADATLWELVERQRCPGQVNVPPVISPILLRN